MANWVNIALKLVKQVQAAQRERERGTGKPRTKTTPRTSQPEHRTRIEYTPSLDGEPDPGEVVWTWVPYQDDPNRGKDRPVVIVGRVDDDLAGVPLTSKNKGRDDHVPVGKGPWDRRNRPSWAKVDRLLTIDPDDVRREGAILDKKHFDDVVEALAKYHDIIRHSSGI